MYPRISFEKAFWGGSFAGAHTNPGCLLFRYLKFIAASEQGQRGPGDWVQSRNTCFADFASSINLNNDMRKVPRVPTRGRVLLILISLLIVLLGVGSLLRGDPNYLNWWGGLVFAPIAIVIGLAGLMIGLFGSMTLADKENKRSRIRGWPTGHARYYRKRDK